MLTKTVGIQIGKFFCSFSLFERKRTKKKQTRVAPLTCGAALWVLRTLLFMIFDMNIENLKAREGDYGGTREDAKVIWG